MNTLTTFALVQEPTEETLEDFKAACIKAMESKGITVIDCFTAYAVPESIPDIPSEILHQAIENACAIAIAFTDFEMPGEEGENNEA